MPFQRVTTRARALLGFAFGIVVVLSVVTTGSVLVGRGGGVLGEQILVAMWAAAAWLATFYVGNWSPLSRSSLALILGLLAAYALAIGTSIDPWVSTIFLFPVIGGLFSYLAARASPWSPMASAWVLVVAGGVFAAAVVGSSVVGAVDGLDLVARVTGSLHIDLSLLPRGAGMSAQPNPAAMTLLPPFGLALGLAAAGPERRRTVAWGFAWLMGIGLLMTGSRGGLLGAGIAALMVAVVIRSRRHLRPRVTPRLRRVVASILVIGAAVSLAVLLPRLFLRPLGRTEIWDATLRLIRERPWTGWGPGTLALTLPSHFADPTAVTSNRWHAHNAFLEMVAELGVVGVALIVTGIVTARRMSISRPSYGTSDWSVVRIGALSGVSAVAVHSLFDTPQLLPGVMAMTGFVLGVGFGRGSDTEGTVKPSSATRLGAMVLTIAVALAGGWFLSLMNDGGAAARLASEGDWKGASVALAGTPFSSASPGTAEELAIAASRLGDLQGARRWIDESLRRQPREWTRWVVAAQIAAEAGDTRQLAGYVDGAMNRGAATSPVGLMALLPFMEAGSSEWFDSAVELVQEYPAVTTSTFWAWLGQGRDQEMIEVVEEAARQRERKSETAGTGTREGSARVRRLNGLSALESGHMDDAKLELAVAAALGDLDSVNLLLTRVPLTQDARAVVVNQGWSIVTGMIPVQTTSTAVSAPDLRERWFMAMRTPSLPPGPVLPGPWVYAAPSVVSEFLQLVGSR